MNKLAWHKLSIVTDQQNKVPLQVETCKLNVWKAAHINQSRQLKEPNWHYWHATEKHRCLMRSNLVSTSHSVANRTPLRYYQGNLNRNEVKYGTMFLITLVKNAFQGWSSRQMLRPFPWPKNLTTALKIKIHSLSLHKQTMNVVTEEQKLYKPCVCSTTFQTAPKRIHDIFSQAFKSTQY